ncbi:hypothetical protein [Algoriphagus boritolerans]
MIGALGKLKQVQRLFLWNSGLNEAEKEELKKSPARYDDRFWI